MCNYYFSIGRYLRSNTLIYVIGKKFNILFECIKKLLILYIVIR